MQGERGAPDRTDAPTMERRRRAGRDPAAFRRQGTRNWAWGGIAALAATAFLPLLLPGTAVLTDRLVPALSLVFLLAAGGFWLGMGGRALPVAFAMVAAVYALTAWTRFAFEMDDFFVLAVMTSFLVFALAGFNLVFVLEEVVYDTHRLLHLRSRAWLALPTATVVAMAVGLPFLSTLGWPRLPALWVTSLVATGVLGGWWLVRAFNVLPETRILRELHLLTFGTLAASLLADLVGLLDETEGLLPSLLAYVALLATWFYVSYTTLQRTHFLMPGANARPWLAILLSASFAILAHAQTRFRVGGGQAVLDLMDQRIAYLLMGIWLGIGFYVVQGVWRLLRTLRDAPLGGRSRIVAGRLARVAEEALGTERRLETAAYRLYRGVDAALPGMRRPPRRPGWDLDPQEGRVELFDHASDAEE